MNTKLLFISLVFALPVCGQTNSIVTVGDTIVVHKHIKPSFTIGGSIGCGIPEEGYGLTPSNPGLYNVIQPGYADPGFYFNINLECHLGKHFGLVAEGAGTINALDKKFYNDDPADGIIGGTGGTYYITTFMAGPFYSLQFKNGNIFETRLLLGCMMVYESDILPKYSPAYQPAAISTIEGLETRGFCAELGTKFKLHITKRTYITIDASYTHGFDYNMYYVTPVSFRISNPEGFLGILNTSLGMEFKL